MRFRLSTVRSEKSRRVLATILVASFAFAAVLSAAPQLHERLHKIGDRTNHACAATLMSSGSVEHSACEPPFAAPQPAPAVPAFRVPAFAWVLAPLEFTRLEHAPPVLS